MNSVDEVLKYLYSLQQRGIKLGLDRVYNFQDILEYPDRSYQTIHVAGTNGKGSVVRFISAMLESLGLRVGRYTSPHLIRFNERISINGKEISDPEIVGFVRKWRSKIDELGLTFFETTTLLAMDYFRQNQVDVTVLETGLGGRLDATNIVNPLVTAITSISYDHTQVLGETIAEIAVEKAGIMKEGVPCIHGPLSEQAVAVLQERGESIGTEVMDAYSTLQVNNTRLTPDMTEFTVTAGNDKYDFALSALGKQAITNAVISLAVLDGQDRYEVSWEKRQRSLYNVNIPGRLHLLNRSPLLYYDVAHNHDGIRNLVENLEVLYPEKDFRFLLNLHTDKDISRFDTILPDSAAIGVLDLGDDTMHDLASWEKVLGKERVSYFGAGEKAVEKFTETVGANEVGVISGSHYLAEAVNRVWKFLLDT